MKYAGAGQQVRFSDLVTDDEKLSLAAKGAFLVLDLLGNDVTLDRLLTKTADRQDAVRRAVDELVAAGYVRLASGSLSKVPPAEFGLGSAAKPEAVAAGAAERPVT
jgi:hypothetical protein